MSEKQLYNPDNNPEYNNRRFGPGERFSFERTEENGLDILIKRGSSSELYENLDRELLWSEFMAYIGTNFPEAKLRSPEILGLSRDRTELKMEYISSPLLAAENGLGSLDGDRFSRFVQSLEIFDQAGGQWQPRTHRDDSNDHTPYDQVDKSWGEWYRHTGISGLVTPEMDFEARRLVDEYKQYLTPRLQHGDYFPWQIFDDNGEWITFDAEHASETKPRYYDLAYIYARTFVLARDPDTARRLLAEFLPQHPESEEDFFKAFLPVLMSRSMGMFLDTYFATKRGQFGYKDYAKDLYDRCLQRSLPALLSR